MDYTVETYPDVGFGSATSQGSGTYDITISGLTEYTPYTWYVNVTDGIDWTNETYTFYTKLPDAFDPLDKGFVYWKEITINHNMVDADLYDFPLLIDTVDLDLISHVQDDGDDIIFMDDVGTATKLNHEIELYDNGDGHLVAWIRIPLLSSTADTTVYMCYGNPTINN